MMSEHTNGPWEACQRGAYGDFDCNSRVIRSSDPDDMRRIAAVHCYAGDAETYANARLIAAAPEMLEALENTIALCDAGFDPDFDEINASIAKARGKG